MSLSASLNKRIRPRREEEEDAEEVDDLESSASSSASEDEDASDSDGGRATSDDEEEEEEDDDDENPAINASLKDISFGALARAQESMPHDPNKEKKNKNKRRKLSNDDGSSSDSSPAHEHKHKPEQPPSTAPGSNLDYWKEKKHKTKKDLPRRSSKHAPQSLPSTRPTTRRRTVVSVPGGAAKPRDPRFDAAVAAAASSSTSASGSASKHTAAPGAGGPDDKASKDAYAFLDNYRASELSQLRSQISETRKDSTERARLQRELTARLDRNRAFNNRQAELDVRARHKRRERDLLRAGAKEKPYFLKRGDVKREVARERWEGMKGPERKKVVEKRRRRDTAKERKGMPWERRGKEE